MLVAAGTSEEYRGKLDQSTGGALNPVGPKVISLSGDVKNCSLYGSWNAIVFTGEVVVVGKVEKDETSRGGTLVISGFKGVFPMERDTGSASVGLFMG